MTTPARSPRFEFCPYCRTALESIDEGGKPRPRCPACGFTQYLNPAPGAGVIIMRGQEVCLVQRKYPPREGLWTLPTGFMEWDETISRTAVREVKEETGLEVELTALHEVETGVLPPAQPVLVVFFTARECGGELRAGDDAAAVGFYRLDALPGPIAFGAHRRVLAELAARQGIILDPVAPATGDAS